MWKAVYVYFFKHVGYIYIQLIFFLNILLLSMIDSWCASGWLLNMFFSCLANIFKNNVLILCRLLRFNFALLASPVYKLPWVIIFSLAFQNLMRRVFDIPAHGSFQLCCSNAIGNRAGSIVLPQEKSSAHCCGAKEVYEYGSGGKCYSREIQAGKTVAGRIAACLFPLWKTLWERRKTAAFL